MKKTALILILVAALAGLVLWLARGARPAAEPAVLPPAREHAPEPATPAPLAAGEEPDAGGAAPPAAPRAAASEPAQPAPGSVPAARESVPADDRRARAWLELTVADKDGAAVEGAVIAMDGLRTKSEGSAHYAWPLEPSQALSDKNGRARLWYPVWVHDVDLTGAVSFTVEHPGFVPHRELAFPVAAGGGLVTLERGAFVIVTGWIGDPARVIQDVLPRAGDSERVPAEAWVRLADGRLSTDRIPPGRRALALAHVAADKRRYHSAVEIFELAQDEQKELHLELVPALALAGRLDPDVQRPVTGGEVMIGLQGGGTRLGSCVFETRTAPVRSDGSFRFEGLPPWRAEIVGLCDGWVSRRVPTRDPERLGVTRLDDETIAEAQRLLGEHALALQAVDLPSAGEKPFVLLMEPAATLAPTVLDPAERPLAGARVAVWPNVFWSVGYSQVFMQREFACTTDAGGRCAIANLPPGELGFDIEHERFVLPLLPQPWGRPERRGRALLAPGGTAEPVVKLEPREED